MTATAPRAEVLLNRELSWVDFNRRVLELGDDERLPLLERVKFCAIAGSNLDEFFAIRVAKLERELISDPLRRSPDGRTPAETLAALKDAVVMLRFGQDRLWLDELQPALEAAGIAIIPVQECTPRELASLRAYLEAEVRPLLTPLAFGFAAPLPNLRALSLHFLIATRDHDETGFLHLSVPQHLPRFVPLEPDGRIVRLEDAITHFLPAMLGQGMKSSAVFRITRDAEPSGEGHSDRLLDSVESSLRQRRCGNIVRLEIELDGSPRLARVLRKELGVGPNQVYASAAPLGLGDLLELTQLDRPDLKRVSWRPVPGRAFGHRRGVGLLDQIRERDILVHHPYDSFAASVQAFVERARDPHVGALKATVYRTGDSSPTLSSLAKTAQEDKQAAALIELTARFDERRNIDAARDLQDAGVAVVWGFPGLKVHAKLTLLVRREEGRARRYAHIGTGNYHATNACSYEDRSLFTADEDITADVADMFDSLTGQSQPTRFRRCSSVRGFYVTAFFGRSPVWPVQLRRANRRASGSR